MRRHLLLGLPILLLLAGCGQTAPAPAVDPDPRLADFHQRAAEVARNWSTTIDEGWRKGFVPLQDPTVLLGNVALTREAKQAFQAGWYREQVPLPTATPSPGTIRFPDGTLEVGLVSAAEAYRQLDQGDPPPCPGRPRAVPSSPAASGGPDGATSASADAACVPLTVTAAKLGTVPIRTSRGEAEVPAWIFTVPELPAPVARLAVAPDAVDPLPPVDEERWQSTNLRSVQQLTRVDGTRLDYQLGVGACDLEIEPLFAEFDEVVVVAGWAVRPSGVCTDNLVLKPVTVHLGEPLGDRPVLEVFSGHPLLLRHLPD